jgi:DNA-binding MarR family transcriptional regulator
MNAKCYCVSLKSAMRRVSAVYDEALAPVGINIAQYSLLRCVEQLQPATLTALGRAQELDRSTIGRNIRVLEKMGLVTLGRGEDQREAVVALSDAGRDALSRSEPLWEEVQAGFERRLGPEFSETLQATLSRL